MCVADEQLRRLLVATLTAENQRVRTYAYKSKHCTVYIEFARDEK